MSIRSQQLPAVVNLLPESLHFPAALIDAGGLATFPELHALGDTALLHHRYLGLFSSVKCPGDAILRAYDLARELRDAGVPVIGGFHAPMERECLDLLLRGTQPIIVMPGRSVESMRVPRAWRGAMNDGRLLVMSPFDAKVRRVTAKLADQRNNLVAELSAALLFIHVAAGGKSEQILSTAARSGKPTFLATANDPPWRFDVDAAWSALAPLTPPHPPAPAPQSHAAPRPPRSG